MANRSYLYSVNEIPGTATTQTLTVRGLSEYNYEIPLPFLLLLSGNTQRCFSIFSGEPERTCLAGDLEEGLKNLELFGSLVLASDIDTSGTFPKRLAETLEFLRDKKRAQNFFYLELTEIHAFDTADMLETNMEEYTDKIREIRQAVQSRKLTEMSLSSKDLDCFGADYWTEFLFYDMSSPFEFIPPYIFTPTEATSPEVAKQKTSLFAQALSHSR